ncbi:carbohydrate ABC transporter permease [Kineococcus sp. SYSU DK004]|uniref:carbohydrate ABC transporter permease n=1 Tax=Kineococcus sp. SYSU DK004 TaxID=3383125 RepID=UPI003D7E19E1
MSTTATPAGAAVAADEGISTRRRRRSDRARAEARLGWMLAGPAFAVLVLVTGYPIVQALYDSLFRYRLTAPDEREFTGLGNYGVILGDPLWWQALGVTALITVVTVAVELVIGFVFAFVMHRVLGLLRPVLRTAILIPYAIITVVSAFAWQFAFDLTAGFINTLPFVPDNFDWFANTWSALLVICLSEIWKTTPFIALLLLAGLAQVSEDMLEAARVDGATFKERLFRVIIPNMKASIMVALLFRALDAFRIFDNVFIMTNGAAGTQTVSFLAYSQTIGRLEIGLGSALSVLLFLCVIAICFVAIKGFGVDLARARGES